jgi:hypothetical protein
MKPLSEHLLAQIRYTWYSVTITIYSTVVIFVQILWEILSIEITS